MSGERGSLRFAAPPVGAWLARLPHRAAFGAAVGAATLGAGGRLAMYAFARLTDRPPLVTLRGSATVVFAGAVAGVVGALLYGAVARWFLPHAPTAVRGLLLGAMLLVVYAPGIRPPWPLTFALFTPAFLAYGLLLCALWPRWGRGREHPRR
jgi:hypothetical protein